MQFNTIVALLIAATGAVAAPGGKPPPPPPPPPKPAPPTINQQSSSISCSTGAPYCCTSETDKTGKNYFACSELNDVCNSIAVCCSQQTQGGSNAKQNCAAFGSATVLFVN